MRPWKRRVRDANSASRLDRQHHTYRRTAQESGSHILGFATIALVIGPGIVKARAEPVVIAQPMVVVRASVARWRDMFDDADVVSEGSVRTEAQGRFWYGSTSLILPAAASDAPFYAAVASRDIHVRLRALRAAHREASSRAPGRLGQLSCEVRIVADRCGVRIDVDVQAPLIERRMTARPNT